MAESQCAGCGRTFYRRTGTHKFCTPACREHHRALDPSRRRRYSTPHQRLRARTAVLVEAGQANCSRCGLPIAPGTDWDLDHADDGVTYLGPSHAACNRATTPPARIRDDVLIWSRKWFDNPPPGTRCGTEVFRDGYWQVGG